MSRLLEQQIQRQGLWGTRVRSDVESFHSVPTWPKRLTPSSCDRYWRTSCLKLSYSTASSLTALLLLAVTASLLSYLFSEPWFSHRIRFLELEGTERSLVQPGHIAGERTVKCGTISPSGHVPLFPRDLRGAVIAYSNTMSDGVAAVVAEIVARSLLSQHGALLGCTFHLLFLTEDTFFLSVRPSRTGPCAVGWSWAYGGRGSRPVRHSTTSTPSWVGTAMAPRRVPQTHSKMQVLCEPQLTSLRFADKQTKRFFGWFYISILIPPWVSFMCIFVCWRPELRQWVRRYNLFLK